MKEGTSTPRRRAVALFILALALAAAYFILTYERQAPPASETASEARPPEPAAGGSASIRLVSWNLLNFGSSKDEQEVAFIAGVLRDADLVALQEVITSPAGAQAVARLDAELDRTGARWDYVISDPTSGQGSERYAFLWKTARVRLAGQPWLEPSLADPIDREPYLARFEARQTGRQMLVANFHAVPTAKRPADEVALLDALHARYTADNLIVVGDFNLSQDHAAFDGLKAAGYRPVLVDQRTSIRMRARDGQHLANEYDNIFYETTPLGIDGAGVLDFTGAFPTLRAAREISDHLPVYADVSWH